MDYDGRGAAMTHARTVWHGGMSASVEKTVSSVSYGAVCTPSLDASDHLDVLVDCLLENGAFTDDVENPRVEALKCARAFWPFHERTPSLDVEGTWRVRVVEGRLHIIRNDMQVLMVRFHILDGDLVGHEFITAVQPQSMGRVSRETFKGFGPATESGLPVGECNLTTRRTRTYNRREFLHHAWSPLGSEVRRSGRTTRMVQAAVERALAGGEVLIMAATEFEAKAINDLVLRMIRDRILEHALWPRIQVDSPATEHRTRGRDSRRDSKITATWRRARTCRTLSRPHEHPRLESSPRRNGRATCESQRRSRLRMRLVLCNRRSINRCSSRVQVPPRSVGHRSERIRAKGTCV